MKTYLLMLLYLVFSVSTAEYKELEALRQSSRQVLFGKIPHIFREFPE